MPVCALFVEALANPDLQMPFREAAQRRDVAQLNSLVRNGVLTIWQAGQAGVVASDMTLDNLGVRDNGDVVICDLGEWTKSDATKLKKATTNFLTSCTGMLKPFPIILDTFQWASGWCKPALAPPGFIDGGSEYLHGLCCKLLTRQSRKETAWVASAVELCGAPVVHRSAAPSPATQKPQQASFACEIQSASPVVPLWVPARPMHERRYAPHPPRRNKSLPAEDVWDEISSAVHACTEREDNEQLAQSVERRNDCHVEDV